MMFVSALLQYNTGSNAVSANVRLRWEYRPGSELFVVYNEQRDTAGGAVSRPAEPRGHREGQPAVPVLTTPTRFLRAMVCRWRDVHRAAVGRCRARYKRGNIRMLHRRGFAYAAALVALSALSNPVSAQTCVAPPNGLVAWVPGDGHANDIVGDVVGTTQGSVTYATGMVGQGLHFDGATSMLTFPRRSALDVGEQVTIDFWMRADPDNPMNVQGLVTTDFYGLEIGGGFTPVIGAEFYVSIDGSSFHHSTDGSSGSPLITPGVWYHYAGVYDGTSLSLYENGVLVRQAFHSGVIAPMLPTSFLSIGSEDGLAFDPNPPDRKNRFFKGLIDEIHIFDRALSAAEIVDIYTAGSAGACKPSEGPVTSTSIWIGLANSDDVGIRFDLAGRSLQEFDGAGERRRDRQRERW